MHVRLFFALFVVSLVALNCVRYGTVYVDDRFDGQQRELVVEAFKRWHAATGSPAFDRKLEFINMSDVHSDEETVCGRRLEVVALMSGDNMFKHIREKVGPTVVGIGCKHGRIFVILGAETGKEDFLHTVMHELGHHVGLEHSGPGTLMWGGGFLGKYGPPEVDVETRTRACELLDCSPETGLR